MENRLKTKQIHLRFSDEKHKFIKEKFRLSGYKNMQDFIFDCILDQIIVEVDTTPFRKISANLSAIGNNINQIAKKCNETQNILYPEVKELQNNFEEIKSETLNDILTLRKTLKNAKIKRKDFLKKYNGNNKNTSD